MSSFLLTREGADEFHRDLKARLGQIEEPGHMHKKRKPTVCVDLDATLAMYEEWRGMDVIGDPLPGAREFLEELSTFARVSIFTVRNREPKGVEATKAWLEKHSMPHDEVYVGGQKPLAIAFVDDRAVRCAPQEDEGAYAAAMAALRRYFI